MEKGRPPKRDGRPSHITRPAWRKPRRPERHYFFLRLVFFAGFFAVFFFAAFFAFGMQAIRYFLPLDLVSITPGMKPPDFAGQRDVHGPCGPADEATARGEPALGGADYSILFSAV
jgi:hypothetical protein